MEKTSFPHDGKKRTNEKRDHISYHIIYVRHASSRVQPQGMRHDHEFDVETICFHTCRVGIL